MDVASAESKTFPPKNFYHLLQEMQELRLPLEVIDLLQGVEEAYSGGSSRTSPEVFLEMRAQLTTATPWAPMVDNPFSS